MTYTLYFIKAGALRGDSPILKIVTKQLCICNHIMGQKNMQFDIFVSYPFNSFFLCSENEDCCDVSITLSSSDLAGILKVFIYLSIYLYVYSTIYFAAFLSINLYIYGYVLLIYLSTFLYLYLLSIYLCICLSVQCPFIYLYLFVCIYPSPLSFCLSDIALN